MRHCPTCDSQGFEISVLGKDRCTFCDGTEGGNPPTPQDIADALAAKKPKRALYMTSGKQFGKLSTQIRDLVKAMGLEGSIKVTSPDVEELGRTIRCIHTMYYAGTFIETPEAALKFHQHMEALFNFAGIESTLEQNNPDKPTKQDLQDVIDKRNGH